MPPDLTLEAAHGGAVAGVDEAGRGPWAGPVVAAAVILNGATVPAGIDDSKALAAARREALHGELRETAMRTRRKTLCRGDIGVFWVSGVRHVLMCLPL